MNNSLSKLDSYDVLSQEEMFGISGGLLATVFFIKVGAWKVKVTGAQVFGASFGAGAATAGIAMGN